MANADTLKAANIAPDATAPTTRFDSARAPKLLTRNPTNGRSGIQRSIGR
jgi:hypothetical protein